MSHPSDNAATGADAEAPERRALLDSLVGELRGLRRFARGLLFDRVGADDAVQDAWLLALRKRAPENVSTAGWMRGIVRNLVRQERRGDARRARRERQAAAPEAVPAARDAASRIEIVRLLMDALETLPEPQRTIVSMRFLDGLPPRVIAKRLLLPVNTVRGHVQRGLSRLRATLDEDGQGRTRMLSILAPLAGPPPWFIPPPLESTLTSGSLKSGVLAMSGKWMMTAAVVAALVVSFWWSQEDARAPTLIESGSGVAVPAPPNEIARDAADASAAVPTRSEPIASVAVLQVIGRVVDPSMRPIAGVPLRLIAKEIGLSSSSTGSREVLGRSGAEGRFELTASGPETSWNVTVAVVGPEWFGYEERRLVPVGIAPEEIQIVAHRQDATVIGRVVDKSGGGISQATVRGPGQEVGCGVDGAFSLPIPSTLLSLSITAAADGFARHTVHLESVRGGAVSKLTIEMTGELRVKGRVVGPGDQPVAGAVVSVVGGQRVSCDERGDYEIGGLNPSPGVILLQGSAPGWIMSQVQISIQPPGRRWVVEKQDGLLVVNANEITAGTVLDCVIRLKKGQVVTGTVLDPAGLPIGGASVWLGDQRGLIDVTAVTDASGAYRLVPVPIGDHQAVRASHPFYALGEISVGVDGDGMDTVAPPISLTQGRALAGRFIGPMGEPVPYARVALERGEELIWTGAADGIGAFRATGLPDDELHLRVGAEGFLHATETVRSGREDVVVRLERSSGITARVVDDATGEPVVSFEVRLFTPTIAEPGVEFAQVWSTWNEGKQFHVEDGRFDTGRMGLKASSVVGIEVRATGYALHRNDHYVIPIEAGADSLTIRLSGGAVVRGTVFHEGSGAAVGGATVRMMRHPDGSQVGDTASTDDRGSFRMSAPPGEMVRLWIERAGARVITDGPFDIPADGGTILRRIEIGGAAVVVFVVAAGEAPAVGVGVSLRGAGVTRQGQTDERGAVRFEELAEGTVTVLLMDHLIDGDGATQFPRAMQMVTVAPAQETTIHMRSGGGLVVRGTVRGVEAVDGSGGGSGDVIVTAIQRGPDGEPESAWRTRVEDDGSFELDGLSAGTWEVEAAFRDPTTRATWKGTTSIELGAEAPALLDIILTETTSR